MQGFFFVVSMEFNKEFSKRCEREYPELYTTSERTGSNARQDIKELISTNEKQIQSVEIYLQRWLGESKQGLKGYTVREYMSGLSALIKHNEAEKEANEKR